jgi:Tol biopolymer transport system component
MERNSMKEIAMSSVPKSLAALVCALVLVSIAAWPAAEKTPFTAADSLRVKSFSVQSVTDDGRFIAGFVTTPYDRLGTDHHRFGDPTYIAPRPAEAVILDTSTGRMEPLFKDKVHVQGMTWSPDGKTLAFFLRKGNAFSLHTYDREKKRLREIRLRSQKAISSNSAAHLDERRTERSDFTAVSRLGENVPGRLSRGDDGPVIVYDSREPFLKWDAVRDRSLLDIPALADAASGGVRELLPEGRHGDIRIAEDDTFITYSLIHPVATLYGRSESGQDGREYELFRLDLADGAEPKILVPRTDKRRTYAWTEDGRRFAWAEDGDIFVQTVDETEPRNLTRTSPRDRRPPTRGRGNPRRTRKTKRKKLRFSVVRWSPDGGRLLARTDKGYWLFDPQTGDRDMFFAFAERDKESRLRPEPQPAVAAWSPDGRYLYLTHAARDRWERGFTRFDLQEKRRDDLVKDSGLYRGLRMSKDGATFPLFLVRRRFSRRACPDGRRLQGKAHAHRSQSLDPRKNADPERACPLPRRRRPGAFRNSLLPGRL